MTIRHELEVGSTHDGLRLDRALAELHLQWTRSRAQRLIDDDLVTVNGKPAKASTRVKTGDLVVVLEPEVAPPTAEPEDIDLDIIHEDEDVLVVNKPPGLVIHPAAGNPSGTLVNALLHHCSDLSGIGGVGRPGIVHRLDKDTSGLVAVAKTDRAHLALSIAFRQRTVHKTYLAVCYGNPETDEGVIDAPIDRHPRERKRMAVVASGRPARTLFRVEERFAGASLLHCRLVTGRTHQIRVHLAHDGHALVGDPVYSGRQWRNLSDPSLQALCRSFPRQALHAWRLGFAHPATGEGVEFEAPVPEDMASLVASLKGNVQR